MKKLICILLTLMLCFAAAGCAVRDPGPPSGAIFGSDGVDAYFEMTDALDLPEDDLQAYLDESRDVSTREEIEKIKALAESAPYPILEGFDLSNLSVMHSAATVTYYLKKGEQLIIFSFHIDPEKDAPESFEEATLKIRRMIKYRSGDAVVSRAKCRVGEASLLVTMRGVNKRELRELLKNVRFVGIEEMAESKTVAGEELQQTPLYGITAEEIAWVGYMDNSVPPDQFVLEYTDKDEIAEILEMFAELEPIAERMDEETEDGNYCAYTVRMNDGSEQVISRSGRNVSWDGKYYTGKLTKVPGKGDVWLHLDKHFYQYGENIPVKMELTVFDPVSAQIVLPITIKKMNESGTKWEALELITEEDEYTQSVSETDLTVNLRQTYKDVTAGDYKMVLKVILPSGEERMIEELFTVEQNQ